MLKVNVSYLSHSGHCSTVTDSSITCTEQSPYYIILDGTSNLQQINSELEEISSGCCGNIEIPEEFDFEYCVSLNYFLPD